MKKCKSRFFPCWLVLLIIATVALSPATGMSNEWLKVSTKYPSRSIPDADKARFVLEGMQPKGLCVVSHAVGNQAELDDAISAFNAEDRGCSHIITLNDDIFLTTSTPVIDNETARLLIEGNGFRVDGQDIEDVRPFEIAGDTVVDMEQITVKGGNIYDPGGGIYNRGTLVITNSTLSGNYAQEGGAIYNGEGEVTLTNCTLSDNEAIYGGGVFNADGVLTLTNCTAANNRAYVGGGIYLLEGTVILANSIIANSSHGDCRSGGHGAVSAFSSLIKDSGFMACDITDGMDGNIIGANPRLGPLTDNGGTTLTHALLRGSPAIDAGDDELALDPDGDPLATDQRGAWRVFGGQVDIGAYESFTTHFVLPLPEWVPLPGK